MSEQHPPRHHVVYRPDIDGMRAIAVLSVVIYHAFPKWLHGGFIGVDIFFVISGYLISLALMDHIGKGSFSFTDFYARRIKRIFPALIVVLLSCLGFGWFWLLSDEYMNLGRHVASGAAFISNFVLWSESGYFDASAESKPLLHLWSLGIEEQFYIFWPVLLWAAWKSGIPLVWPIVAFGLLSFGWNVHSITVDATATFYSPLTRVWELLCGSLLAWWALRRGHQIKAGERATDAGRGAASFSEQVLSTAGLLLLAAGLLVIRDNSLFPGFWALLPVAGAVCLIAAGPNAWLNRYVLSRPVAVWVGLISYPLYLWHWPLLTFARMIAVKGLSDAVLAGIVALSIVMAWLTYRLIEKPLRFNSKKTWVVPVLVAGMVITGAAGLLVNKLSGIPMRTNTELSEHLERIRPNIGLHRDCLPDKTFTSGNCVHGEKLDLYLWGDSHAMHFADALRAGGNSAGFRQQTMTACPPILDLSPLSPRYTEAWGWKCMEHNQNVFDWLIRQKGFEYVVLASPFRVNEKLLITEGVVKGSRDIYLQHLQHTVEKLRMHGFKPIIIAPAPASGYSMGRCWARMSLIDQASYCDFKYQDSTKATFETDEMMTVATGFAPVLFLRDLICPGGLCSTTINGVPVYRDGGHLSAEGSKALGEKFHLPRVVREQADRYWDAAR